MTIMTKRGFVVLLLLVVIIGIASVVGFAFSAIVTVGAGDDTEAASAKLLSERVLFAGIIAAVVTVLSGAVLIIRATNVTQLLDKLVAMNQMTGFSADSALRRLGDVGERIQTIYRQMSQLSEKKSLKISALSALNELLLNLSDQLALVVDPVGKVLQASRPLLERLGKSRTEVVGVAVDDLIPDANFSDAAREAAQTRTPVVRERKGDSLVFNPVINRDGEVAYMVALLTRAVTDDMKRVAVSARAPGRKELQRGYLARLVKRRRDRI